MLTLTRHRRALALWVVLALVLAFTASPAYAADNTMIGVTLSPAFVAKVLAILAALGVLLPHLQAILQKPWANPRVKAIGAVVLAILGGLVGFVITNGGGLDWSDPVKIALWISGVYTTSTTLYARLFKAIGSTDYLENTVNAGGAPEVTDGPAAELDDKQPRDPVTGRYVDEDTPQG